MSVTDSPTSVAVLLRGQAVKEKLAKQARERRLKQVSGNHGLCVLNVSTRFRVMIFDNRVPISGTRS